MIVFVPKFDLTIQYVLVKPIECLSLWLIPLSSLLLVPISPPTERKTKLRRNRWPERPLRVTKCQPLCNSLLNSNVIESPDW